MSESKGWSCYLLACADGSYYFALQPVGQPAQAGQLGLIDQLHHRQQRLPVLGQQAGQALGILLLNRVISSLHGGSLLSHRDLQPDSNRIGPENRRSTSNGIRGTLLKDADDALRG